VQNREVIEVGFGDFGRNSSNHQMKLTGPASRLSRDNALQAARQLIWNVRAG
jgi:hypothetical protein